MKPLSLFFIFVLINFHLTTSAYIITKYNAGGTEKSTIYNSIDDFKQKNPDTELIPMKLISNPLSISRSYVLGARQTGDAVVANINNKKTWPVAQNITTTLTYPSSGGSGAFLTYILINCEQSSNIGQAYVTYGGVHQHFIQIVLEARISTYFNYAAFFYGIK